MRNLGFSLEIHDGLCHLGAALETLYDAGGIHVILRLMNVHASE